MRHTTQGDNAYALLVQSMAAAAAWAPSLQDIATTATLGGASGASGNGGQVSIALTSAVFQTFGIGAHGLVAQSIGGGGGIAGYATGVPTLSTSPAIFQDPDGNGGEVTVAFLGSIVTKGAGAHGIVAQSIASGGGLLADGGTLYAGSTGILPNSLAGDVSISVGLHGWTRPRVTTPSASSPRVRVRAAPTGARCGWMWTDLLAGGGDPGGRGLGGRRQRAKYTHCRFGRRDQCPIRYAINYTGLYGLNVANGGQVSGSWHLGGGAFTNDALVVTGATLDGRLLTNNATLQIGPTGTFDEPGSPGI